MGKASMSRCCSGLWDRLQLQGPLFSRKRGSKHIFG